VSSVPEGTAVLKGWNPVASALLGVFLFVSGVAGGLYAARGLQPSPLFSLLYYLGLAGLVRYWVHTDRLRRSVSGSLDSGFFFLFTWPLAFPGYLIGTRGFWRGLGVAALFALAFLCTWGLSIAIFFIAGGRV